MRWFGQTIERLSVQARPTNGNLRFALVQSAGIPIPDLVIETQGDNAGVICEGVNHVPGSRLLLIDRPVPYPHRISEWTRSRKILDIVYLLLIYQWWTYSCLLPIVFQMTCSTCSP
jgi:hypothetical protein